MNDKENHDDGRENGDHGDDNNIDKDKDGIVNNPE